MRICDLFGAHPEKNGQRHRTVRERPKAAKAGCLLALTTLGLAACSTAEPAQVPTVSIADCPRGETAKVTVAEVNRGSAFDSTPTYGFGAPDEEVSKRGTTVTLAARPDLNVEWLERVARCQRLAYEQGLLPLDSTDPLAVEGIQVDVRQANAGYLVELKADDENSSDELYERSLALMEQPNKTWEIGWR